MGGVFGRATVEEPVYQVLLSRTKAATSYELRKYGVRFVAETPWESDDGTPFGTLAKYIGVFGNPENEGEEKIDMTAPVARTEGTAIAMTAPVTRTEEGGTGTQTMQFTLPAKYDDISQIPKPTNPQVTIKEIPESVGAVHRFNGAFQETKCRKLISSLAQQLKEDGVDVSESELAGAESMGYNPPWTIPYFKRNEVWIPLSQEQVDHLISQFSPN